MKRVVVRRDTYHDSVRLMELSAVLKRTAGTEKAVVAMGTAQNLQLMEGLGFSFAAPRPGPGDLVIAIDAQDEEAAAKAEETVDALLKRARPAAGGVAPARRGPPRSTGRCGSCRAPTSRSSRCRGATLRSRRRARSSAAST